MTERTQQRVVLDEIPRVTQKLKLACTRCGRKAAYDVGAIFLDQEGKGESVRTHCAFSNYFRCRNCGGAGPWEIVNSLDVLALTLRAPLGNAGRRIIAGQCRLFDGTTIQSPAMGEEYLLRLIDNDPRNAFLCTRLGNLLRGCGQTTRAIDWYEKALALDAGDIEARYNLYWFAVDSCDFAPAIAHGQLLVRHLLEGHRTNQEDLTRGIALSVADTLRSAPPEVRGEFLGKPKAAPEPPERTFIRTLLQEYGDEDRIVMDAADRLLDHEVAPAGTVVRIEASNASVMGIQEATREQSAPNSSDAVETDMTTNSDGRTADLFPSLREVVEKAGLNTRKLTVGLEANDHGQNGVTDRHSVPVTDGENVAWWPVASLRELFRGNQPPPADMDHYPPECCVFLFFIEKHLLTACDAQGDRTDQEMESIYSGLRRRPDGRSLGATHDFLWQVLALMLGTNALSQAQFEALVGQLERSVRKWALRPVSRNYVHYLRSHLP